MFDTFISYRRRDSRADAGRLYDRLSAHFGDAHVFMDIDDIEPGQDFVQVLEKTLDVCGVVIVVIGRSWLGDLEDPKDFVRLEIQRALDRNIRVIPVLVGGAAMPKWAELPSELAGLSHRQAFEITDQRFHADVDRLISALEKEEPGFGKTRVSRVLRWSAAVMGVVVLAAGLYWGVDFFAGGRETRATIRIHSDAGDRFVEQDNYGQAIGEYQNALQAGPEITGLHRKLISATRERLLRTAFGSGAIDVGLRRDYGDFKPVPDEEIDEALKRVYRLRTLEPSLNDDVDLLLDEALILKSGGARATRAIPLLERAHQLSPARPDVLAELGLLSALLQQDSGGARLIGRAIEMQPEQARYHFYRARSLDQVYLCPFAGLTYSGSGDREACAEAVREYRRASDLAQADDLWSSQIRTRSVGSALNIFSRYVRKEKSVLTPRMGLSLDERISELEYLIPREQGRGRAGADDYPRFWLATLYEAQGRHGEAQTLMRELLEEKGYRAVPWLKLYAQILQETGSDEEALARTQALLEGAER